MHVLHRYFGWKAGSLALLILGGVALSFWWRHSNSVPRNSTWSNPRPGSGLSRSSPTRTNATPDIFESHIASLQAAPSPQAARQALAALKSHLASLSPQMASMAIRGFLDSGKDMPTRLRFAVGANGFLTGSPSLRVFLLDYLAQVDPAGATVYAERILSEMNSPDEWAVALRNYSLGSATPEGRSFLEEKVAALLQHEPWQQQPSVGYLEAFDVAVSLGGTKLMPELATLVRKTDNQAVARAAFLALDRLTIADPVTTLSELQTDSELMKGREVTRANFLARADAGDPQQKSILENYLLNPGISPAELATFAGLYPNANYMISYNLVTRTQTPDHDTLVRRDRDALLAVDGWLADPLFQSLQPQLQTIKNRLETFLKQAATGH